MLLKRWKFWGNRTKLEKWIPIVTLVVEIIAIALILTLGMVIYNLSSGNRHEENICLTPECIHIASTALELMDLSVDPCEDFFDFTCGNFVKSAIIPDDRAAVSVSTMVGDLLEEQLRTEIEKAAEPDEPIGFTLVKKLYKACMNLTVIEAIGLKEIKSTLDKFSGWPVLEGDKWKREDFDWKKIIYKFKDKGFGMDYLVDLWIGADQKNSSKRIIHIDEAYLGLDEEYLRKGLKDKLVEAYYEYMVDVAVILGANATTARRELLESLKFEMNLARISLSLEDHMDPLKLYNPMSIREMENKYPKIPWLEYINNILNSYVQVTDNETVSVISPRYVRDLTKLINKTPDRVQANYLIWRAVQSSAYYLTDELRKRRFKYLAVSTGEVSQKQRWKQCVSIVSDKLTTAVGAMYVRRYFHEDARIGIKEIVASIQDEFKSILQNVNWMDERTRKNALKKLDAMVTHIAYPDELLDNGKLDALYADLEVNSTDFWKSILNIKQFNTNYTLKRFRLPINKTYWVDFSDTTIVDAYYASSRNSIELPAGILQGVFFNNGYPKYFNYGGIGYVIGHEITHGFDNQGRHYDKNGNLVNWWANKTREAFTKKTRCIIDQYSNYSVPEVGMNVNGRTTLNENIADIGGIKESYLAYARWLEENGNEPALPGLNKYSERQMFWIAAGISWCTKSRPEDLKQYILTDEHAPEKYRVWGSVSNMKEFAEDFHCKPNTKMNPNKKCYIW